MPFSKAYRAPANRFGHASNYVVLFDVLVAVALDDNFFVIFFFQLLDAFMLLLLKERRHIGMDADHDLLFLGGGAEPPDLPEDLVAHGRRRFGVAAAFAVGAWLAQHPEEVLPDPLAGHLHQAQLRNPEQIGLRPVMAHRLLKSAVNL